MNKWTKPEVKVVANKELSDIVNNILTIESSLYASGCHRGMQVIVNR